MNITLYTQSLLCVTYLIGIWHYVLRDAITLVNKYRSDVCHVITLYTNVAVNYVYTELWHTLLIMFNIL